jgi:hypothetical protein
MKAAGRDFCPAILGFHSNHDIGVLLFALLPCSPVGIGSGGLRCFSWCPGGIFTGIAWRFWFHVRLTEAQRQWHCCSPDGRCARVPPGYFLRYSNERKRVTATSHMPQGKDCMHDAAAAQGIALFIAMSATGLALGGALPTNATSSNWTVLAEIWQALRVRWEYSHPAGAIFPPISFAALVVASPSHTRRRCRRGNCQCIGALGDAE